MEQESTFLTYVRYIFKRWAGFQKAISEGMGGIYTKEKELWLGNEVENYFKRYDDVELEDIEDYLGTMIEDEFHTYFEDGSLKEVCEKLCVAYPLSLTNPDAEVFEDMKKKTKTTLSSCNSSTDDVKSYIQTKAEEAACEKLEQLTVNEKTEDDGWTVVTKRNKNK